MLQMARADFYNPFSQAVVKITNPTLIPLRKIVPGVFGVDIASIVLALLIQVLVGEIIAVIATGQLILNPLPLIIWGALGMMNMVTYIYLVCLLILVVSSFVAPYSSHPILILVRQMMDPILRPVQKIIPPMGGLDFSVFFVGMGIYIVQKIITAFAVSIGLIPAFVIGF